MLTLSANCSTIPITDEGSVSSSVHDIFMSASGPTPSRRSHDWPAAHPAALAQPPHVLPLRSAGHAHRPDCHLLYGCMPVCVQPPAWHGW